MTDADKVINPQLFRSYPADIRIRIRINPEIWIRIPDHFWLRLHALAEVCTLWLWAQSVVQYFGRGGDGSRWTYSVGGWPMFFVFIRMRMQYSFIIRSSVKMWGWITFGGPCPRSDLEPPTYFGDVCLEYYVPYAIMNNLSACSLRSLPYISQAIDVSVMTVTWWPRPIGKGAISVAFVRPLSVRPSHT